jgi:transcriptional regulator with PAS, ATPase and Fis domain
VLKRIGIVSSKYDVAELLENELKRTLKDKVEFVRYVVDKEKVLCDVDVVVLSGGAVAKYVSIPENKSVPILTPRRTITLEGWEKLKSIPEGTSALVVNDTKETAEETVNLFKEFGLYLKLYPYYPGCTRFPKCETAITPGEERYVPNFVKNVVNVGNRIFEPSTVLELLFRLELFKWEDLEELSKYSKTVKSSQDALQKFLFDMAATRLELETVLSMARQAVMAFSKESGELLFFNEFAKEYFEINQSALKDTKKMLKKFGIDTAKELHNEIVEVNGKEMVLNSKTTPFGTTIISFYPVELHREIERKRIVKIKKSGMVARANFSDIIGGREIQKIVKLAKKMALSDAPILLEGESGTGKELFAQAIHNYSKRNGPFVPINCASLSEELLESELFGYVEGAFTGAKKGGKLGLFEVANGGTIFLDEISELSLSLQSKLLRVLQEKEVIRVGGVQLIPVNVRVITATNRNLFEMMESGKFRMDLFYRISTFQLKLLPLRERIKDLEMLVEFLIEKNGYDISIRKDVLEALEKYKWPGNVREVENFIDYVGNLFSGEIGFEELPPYLSKSLLFTHEISKEEIKVLNFLKDNGEAGRGKIASNCNMNERKVRKILEKLSKNGYVTVKRGRNGTAVTKIGIQFLKGANDYKMVKER